MKKKVMLILSCLFLSLGFVVAQTTRVTGVVLDEAGEPVISAAVVVKGTTVGTTTDLDGKFTINVPEGKKVLVFSLVGMRRVEANATSDMRVVMENDDHTLEDVVITGVGAATDRRKVAISVESVTENDLNKSLNRSVDGALIGKIAGAQISSTSGQPGQQANIILRGINTLTSTQPMILVDGIEVNSANVSNGTGNYSSRLSDLDLSNVERIEVIQGSAAATIYGAQGANGVIQIFTKKGKKGQKTSINYSASLSIDNALKGNIGVPKYHYYDTTADGYIASAATGQRISTDPVTGYWDLPDVAVDINSNNNKEYKDKTYNHLDQYFKSNVVSQSHNLNITGASENIDFSLGLSYNNQESVVHGNYTKYNLTSNIGTELFKGFTIRSTTQLISSKNTTGGVNNRNNIYSGLSSALTTPGFVDLTATDGLGNPIRNYDENSNSIFPFYTYKFRSMEARVKRVIEGLNVNYKINKFVELDYKYGIDHSRYDYTSMIYNQNSTSTPGAGISPVNGELVERARQETKQNSTASAFLRFDLAKDFNLNIPLQSSTQISYDWRQTNYDIIESTGAGYGVDPPFTLSTASTTTASQELSKFVTFGYLINQRFDYDNLFGVSVGVRSDYSSAFGSGSKASTFPRADAYFRLSEIIKKDYLYDLKLRAAYGEAGIQPNAYDRLITASSRPFGNNSSFYLPLISRNPDLNVEKSKEIELGLDYGVTLMQGEWLNRAKGSFVYWTRKTDGAIWDLDMPPSSGASQITTNGVDLTSNGIQLAIDLDMYKSKEIEWNLGIRFSNSKTKVDNILNHKPVVIGSSGSGQTALVEGEVIGAFYGTKPLTSLDQTDSKGVRYIAEADKGNYEIVNGMVVNKASRAVEFTTENEKIGDANPDFTASFINNLTLFKNLSVSFQLDWVKGAQAYNQTKQWMYGSNNHKDLDNQITIDGQTGAWLAYYKSLYNTNSASSYFVEGSSFLRMRDVTVAYNIAPLINSKFIKGLTLSASARNLFTITNYSGLDPEAVGTVVGNPLYRGIDLYSVPNLRSFVFGVNVLF